MNDHERITYDKSNGYGSCLIHFEYCSPTSHSPLTLKGKRTGHTRPTISPKFRE